MVFSNSVFLFLFLPVVLLGYYLLRGRARNYWLLAVSLVFYAWNKPSFLWILIASIGVNYGGALLVDKAEKKKQKFLLLSITVGINLGLLYYFKYFNFTMDILQRLLSREIQFAEVILPIGISFFTFQGLSYVVDVYRQDVPAQRNPFKLGMYISLFPQLVAGPIVRYKDVAAEIDNRSVTLDDFACGIRRFIIGLFKKIIIADTLAITANAMFDRNPAMNTPEFAWLGIVCYSLQLFFDFAGYSDMAIGLGRMFGFHFLENFNYPYISRSITEFWRRWHMSLSSFFRDYVYIPLGGNRVSKPRWVFNIFVVWFATGLWYGASWNFVLWGLYFGVLLLLEKEFFLKFLGKSKVFSHIWALFFIVYGWVIFTQDSLSGIWSYTKALFGGYGMLGTGTTNAVTLLQRADVNVVFILAFAAAIIFSTPIAKKISVCNVLTVPTKRLHQWRGAIFDVVLLVLLFLCTIQLAVGAYNPFIYFRF